MNEEILKEVVLGLEWHFCIVNNEAKICKSNCNSPTIPSETVGDCSVPSYLGGYPVTTIGNCAFEGCEHLTTIILPEGVTTIENCAFEFCSACDIFIPASTSIIMESALECGSEIRNIHVDSSNMNYSSDDGALFDKKNDVLYFFPDGKKISEYVVPSSVKRIAYAAFSCCKNLRKITLSDNLRIIESHAFAWSEFITSIRIPDRVTHIQESAFHGCYFLAEVIFPPKLTHIEDCAFAGCETLPRLSLPESLIEIGPEAFADCYALTEIFIPDSVQILAKDAFDGCTSLVSASVPKHLDTEGMFLRDDFQLHVRD